MKVLYAYVLLVLALILTASPAVSQVQQRESFVVKVAVSDEAVTFHTEGNHTGYAMTVAGPDDFRLEQSFAGDEIPSLRLKTKRGMLANGSYMIQVTAHPYISKEARAALQKVRAEGDKAQTRRMLRKVIGSQDMVYSMSVGIVEGKFLDPFEEEPVDKGEDIGALDIESLQPYGQVALGYVAAPDVTATGPQYAFQTASQTATPQFIEASGDPDSPWVEAYFKNAGPDGSSLVFQGYIRPVESENGTPLFEGYFRPVSARGASQGTWKRNYFEFSGNGFHQIDQPGTATAGQQPFDYLTNDDPAQTEALRRDIVHNDDVIIDGSLCVGFDCVNGESFGFDTIRLKEHNLRIKFDDTSTAASFPRNDWQITANDSANGGASKFSIEDITGGRTVMTIEAGARTHSLYIDDGGRIGSRTSTPSVEIHTVDGDTPTLRLQQDGSSGFAPQTWDVAGNETNFFIRDVTNGSTLPFRIRPGAPTSSIDIDADGNVGIGTASPAAMLHVNETGQNFVSIRLQDTGESIDFTNDGMGRFSVNTDAVAGGELLLDSSGDLTVTGDYFSTTCTTGNPCAPDYVFDEDYELMSLQELKAFIEQNHHLPNVPSESDLREAGVINHSQFQMTLLEKIEELVLYTLQQHHYAQQQQQTIEELNTRLKALEAAQK